MDSICNTEHAQSEVGEAHYAIEKDDDGTI